MPKKKGKNNYECKLTLPMGKLTVINAASKQAATRLARQKASTSIIMECKRIE